MIRVLIADDHSVVRRGLKQLLALADGIVVAGEAKNGEETLEAVRCGKFDLVLLDLTMPDTNGINLIERIRAYDDNPPILVFSMHNEFQIARRVFLAGAAGFITKNSSEDILTLAIRTVAAGERFVDSIIAEQTMFEEPAPETSAPHGRLSRRELHIMKLVAKGKTVNEIANELFISNKTVSTHKTRLMQKMSFQNAAELVRYAANNGLIE